jgi:hypothetical protein
MLACFVFFCGRLVYMIATRSVTFVSCIQFHVLSTFVAETRRLGEIVRILGLQVLHSIAYSLLVLGLGLRVRLIFDLFKILGLKVYKFFFLKYQS